MSNAQLSFYGEHIVGSQIIGINNKIKQSNPKCYNYTIGDFDPKVNPIPEHLELFIKNEYGQHSTNYPMSQGELSLRVAVSTHLKRMYGINYTEKQILIGAGVRPLIYTLFKTLVESNSTVMYPVPSWNNDHYTFLHDGNKVPIETLPENNFNLTLADITNNISKVNLICLCSPQNPTGTMLIKNLKEIMYRVVLENEVRKQTNRRLVYVFFDQIYMGLCDMKNEYHPLNVCPEIFEYLVCVDGISKSLCATGVRVGWMMGPDHIIDKATQIFSHIGAWAPKAEQLAVKDYINLPQHDMFVKEQKVRYKSIIDQFTNLLDKYKSDGFEYIKPDAGIYLSVKLPYRKITTDMDFFMGYLVTECNIGVVPFDCFGTSNSEWFRMSIGTVNPKDMDEHLTNFEDAILKIKKLAEMVGKSTK
jgi:aspartate aminotransferase